MFVSIIFKCIKHIINMPSKHDGMENVKEGWEHYMYHKICPLSNMKVLKI